MFNQCADASTGPRAADPAAPAVLKAAIAAALLTEMAARSDVHRAPYRSGLGEIRGLIVFGDARQATALIVANEFLEAPLSERSG